MLFSDMPLAPNTRVALRVEYHGGAFNGWQAQTKLDVPTVQEALEAGLSKIAAAPVKTSCAGRTDTGVHASGQIVHFDDPVGRSLKSWVFGTNSETPDSISIHWAGDVASDFHARFSATSRRYRYIICNTPTKPAQLTAIGLDPVLKPATCNLPERIASSCAAFDSTGKKTTFRSIIFSRWSVNGFHTFA